ncbi:MAG: SRPBCC family protein [Phycisphaerales bacterium]
MKPSSTDRIEKSIEIKASPARVWRALTDHREFGAWFRVNLEGPFLPGKTARGRITYPGYEHLVMEVTVETLEPERLFSFRWHPYAVEPGVDYSKEPPTLVEFRLRKTPGGTHLSVTESGFDAIPAGRRAEAFRMNSSGWAEQVKNILNHVTANP